MGATKTQPSEGQRRELVRQLQAEVFSRSPIHGMIRSRLAGWRGRWGQLDERGDLSPEDDLRATLELARLTSQATLETLLERAPLLDTRQLLQLASLASSVVTHLSKRDMKSLEEEKDIINIP